MNNEPEFYRVTRKKDLSDCLVVIHESFRTVAEEYGLTEENCPSHPAFMKPDKLRKQFAERRPMFLLKTADGHFAGYFSLHWQEDGIAELENVAILPDYRHQGFGQLMIDKAKEIVHQNGGAKITVGIIEENTALKNWYQSLGFQHLGTKRFDHLPFTVGFMEINI